MDPPGRRDECVQQQERLQREEAYYHFINGLSEEEYRLMRDSNLLGTPGEVTAEELRQRLDGAKEHLSAQPHPESRPELLPESSETGGSGGAEVAGEASNGDSLLEWLNTFRRTGNATRSGQSGNQTWRAVSRTNPNSGEFRFSLEININHEQPEPDGLQGDPLLATPARTTHSRRTQARRIRSSHAPSLTPPPTVPEQHGTSLRSVIALDQPGAPLHGGQSSGARPPTRDVEEGQDCPPPASPRPGLQRALPRSRTRSSGRGHRTGGAHRRPSRRSRSPLLRPPTPGTSHDHGPEPRRQVQVVAMETAGEPVEEAAPPAEPAPEAESQTAGVTGTVVRRHPTIMLDLQVRRIRPGENRDRDSIASRTRSRVRTAENTVTFESDSGGFRRTISRSERAGIRTYVSTIRIPLRRISETGLGEPSSTALRSILRQIMTGFGELSSLMETEADSEAAMPSPPQTYRIHSDEEAGSQEPPESQTVEGDGPIGEGGGIGEGRGSSRDTNNLVENGTLPILRLAHFFLLNEEEEDEHPHGLTKEQIDNLSTRSYGQASLEGELGRTCSVCINEYAQGNKLRCLPCAHEFHIHCIDRWLSQNNTCPICRQPILPAPQD